MKKLPRKKALETIVTSDSKPKQKQNDSKSEIDFSAVHTVYLKKNKRWLTIQKPNSLDGFKVENYIPAANTLFLSKL